MHYIWSNSFQDNGHQTWKGRDLKRWETNVMSLRNTPACCLETVPRLHNTGRENTEGDWQTPWTEETELSPSSQDRVLGERRDLQRRSPLEGCRAPASSIQPSTYQHMQPKARKEPLERIRGHSAQCSQRAGNSAHSHQPAWRSSRFMGQWVECTVGSPLSSGRQWALLSTDYHDLAKFKKSKIQKDQTVSK